MIFKFMFNEKSVNVFIYSVVTYVIFMLSDIVFALIISLLDFIFDFSLAQVVTNSIFSNPLFFFLIKKLR